jgi:putative ABC transport system substrate-binding protein
MSQVKRRTFLTLLGGAALGLPAAAGAQPATKVWRIGMLETLPPAENAANLAAFRNALRELGYVEGKNLIIEYRSADGRTERFSPLAAELVALSTDLMLTRGTPATLAAKNASAALPIVMTSTADPFTLVPSIAHPGGHITGLSSLVNDLSAKRLELLKDMQPGLKRVARLTNYDNPNTVAARELEMQGRPLGIESLLFDVRKTEDIAPAFDAASKARAAALTVGLDTLMQANRQLIALLAVRHRLPAIYAAREFVDAGGLISFGVSYPDLYRRAATYVDKIFKGAKPGDLPIEQPTKFELVINLRAAKAIDLSIPETFLVRADEVIE